MFVGAPIAFTIFSSVAGKEGFCTSPPFAVHRLVIFPKPDAGDTGVRCLHLSIAEQNS
jgi:hypothetical protein